MKVIKSKQLKYIFIFVTICLSLSVASSVKAKETTGRDVYKVTFYSWKGKVLYPAYTKEFKKTNEPKQRRMIMPTIACKENYTFMGWSDKPHTSLQPRYIPGQRITVNQNLKLYAVFFEKSALPNLKQKQIRKIDLTKYSGVIFVGDSKTMHIKYALRKELTSKDNHLPNTFFVAKSGSRIDWLKTEGQKQLFETLKKHPGTAKRPVAIIFGHGVNDLATSKMISEHYNLEGISETYIRYMKSLAKKLKPYHVKLFYNSLTQTNSAVRKNINENRILQFNKKIKNNLCNQNGPFTYIDTMENLNTTGFVFEKYKSGINDGLHFSLKTCRLVYNYVIACVNQ